ncbi:acyltransferase family protein [uncultured Winogradskyella sp.]|uniref:acyltransferase family protein n=1 Tax=uncultured Winogradskyella sp. TaxID=395353 RepID=UPI0030DC9C80|tara:strand:+ start:43915 stop:45057 length:1143 start_codon:yes stop_codon:yes gene_type:complete
MVKENTKPRVEWVDTAKALGMFLVFYGHFIKNLYSGGNDIAFLQHKYIYAFHMPLFFFISGFYFKPVQNFGLKFKQLFLRRLLPVFTFAIISLPLWLLYNLLIDGSMKLSTVAVRLLSYGRGNPQLNIITWFLVCLFISEVIIAAITTIFKNRLILCFIGFVFLISGVIISNRIEQVSALSGIAKNVWFIHSAIVAIGLYLIGYFVYPYINKLIKIAKWMFIPLMFFGFVGLFFTYNKNSPFIGFNVNMITAQFGNLTLFVVSSFLGILGIIALSIMLKSNKIFDFIGKNTLILIGLNGIFYAFINKHLGALFLENGNWWQITFYALFVSVLSLLVCYPIINLFNKYIPQLLGRPKQSGPLLPDLESLNWRAMLRKKLNQ